MGKRGRLITTIRDFEIYEIADAAERAKDNHVIVVIPARVLAGTTVDESVAELEKRGTSDDMTFVVQELHKRWGSGSIAIDWDYPDILTKVRQRSAPDGRDKAKVYDALTRSTAAARTEEAKRIT